MNEQHSFSKAFLKSWSPPAYLLPQLHSVDYAAGYFCLNVCWLKRPGMETVWQSCSSERTCLRCLPQTPAHWQILRAPFINVTVPLHGWMAGSPHPNSHPLRLAIKDAKMLPQLRLPLLPSTLPWISLVTGRWHHSQACPANMVAYIF